MDHVKLAKKAIENAKKGVSNLNKAALMVDGLSSTKSRHLLNNLCSFPDAVYFEIGSWKGSTIIAASFGNKGKFYALDQFSSSFNQKESASIDFYANKEMFSKHCSYTFFEENSWEFDVSKIKEKVNVYFYDGDHTPEGTHKAFTYYNNMFADTFIMIMDDWNREHIRTSTKDALKNYNVLFEQELLTPGGKNDPHGSKRLGGMEGRMVDTWWNGLYLAVLQKL